MARKPPVKVSDQEIVNAVDACHGNYRMAAGKLKIDYATLLRRAKHNPEIEKAKLDACADMITLAEDNVYNELLTGNPQISKWVLERLSREKWGTGNMAGSVGDPIPFTQAEVEDVEEE
jgi:hypothetical protein